MIAPPNPPDEVSRIATLHSLHILDTEAEPQFDRLTRLAQKIFKVSNAIVSLVDRNRQWFKSQTASGFRETDRSISFCGHAILQDQVLVVPDTRLDPRFSANPLVDGPPFVRFYAGCPINIGNSNIGTLCLLDTSPREFGPDDIALLEDLGELVEQEFTTRQRATVDDLTGLSNRRGFAAAAAQALEICRRHELPATLLYFDLSRFKEINDTYGHAEGDRALKKFAMTLRDECRDSDLIGRLGGDEFVVLMVDTCSESAGLVVNRIRESILARRDEVYRIQFSVGHVVFRHDEHGEISDLLAEADKAMYRNKRTAPDAPAPGRMT